MHPNTTNKDHYTATTPQASPEAPQALRVWLLDGFRVSVGLRTIEEGAWRRRKAAALVKLLALAPGHRLHREQVIALLWPDLGRRAAANNLRQALYAARKIIDSDQVAASRYLALQGEQIVLCPEGNLWVDVDAFEELAFSARRSREPAAYEAAIDLYAGELLLEDRYEEWAQERRQELHETYLSLLLGLASASEERGDFGSGVEALRKVIAEDPTREEAHVGLMRLYALSGRKAAALRHYELLRETLFRELGIEPSGSTRALMEEIAAGRFPPEVAGPLGPQSEEPPQPPRHNLPTPRTSFVGRGRELSELKQALAMTNLLTLTGAGGSGKTRLALEVARELAGAYPDGVWFVELAPLPEPELVAQEVADALQVREQPGRPLAETIAQNLCDERALLILDNCEHLIDSAARLADSLLGSCPRLKIMATSREPLGVEGETLFSVPPLSVPAGFPANLGELARNDSVRLFIERARLKLSSFSLVQENAPAVAEVCRKLEGIPLAIELAAARMGALAVEQVAQRLQDSLGLLSAGPRMASQRQRTMRAAIGWSYGLLSEEEKETFGSLSVFAAGFTLEAAEAVCPGAGIDEGEVLYGLSSLVDKSLVVVEATREGGVRYGMLEPVRQYARERLEEGGQAEAVRGRHAEWCLRLAQEAEPHLSGPRSLEWLERLEVEHDNLRAALQWSLDREGPQQLGLRLGAALWWFWYARGHLTEGRRWLEEHLSRSGPAVTEVRAKALNGAGWIAMFQGEFGDARAYSQEALALFRELEDEEEVASALVHLGAAAVLGQLDDAPVPVLLEEATRLWPKIRDPRTIGTLLLLLGLFAAVGGEFDRSEALHEEALALFRKMGDVTGISHCLNNLGLAMLAGRAYDKASGLFRENLRVAYSSDHKVTIQSSLVGMGGVAASRKQPDRAARLWGAAEALEDNFGIRMTPAGLSLADYEGFLALARSHLEEEEFALAWSEGKAMPLQKALEYALSEEETVTTPAPTPEELCANAQPAPLTQREREVATLVASGLTNRRIASELHISERTVSTHVRRIFRKLGVRSREHVADLLTALLERPPEAD
jgi:predicted ATPase/DNA-binding SARP family transcriptional activator/DNA-binding CsgD family transcriptional regulator